MHFKTFEISKEPIKMESPNCTNLFDKTKTTRIRVPPKNICVVSDVAIPPHRSVIFVRSPNPETHIDKITAENLKIKIKRQLSQKPLRILNPVTMQLLERIKLQSNLKSVQAIKKIEEKGNKLNLQIVQNLEQPLVQNVELKTQCLSKPSQNSMQFLAKSMANQSTGAENSQIPLFDSDQTSVQRLQHISQPQLPEKMTIQSVTQNLVHSNKIVDEIFVPKTLQNSTVINGHFRERVLTAIDHGKNIKQTTESSGQLTPILPILPILPPKLRKILPKPQLFDPDTVPTFKVFRRVNSELNVSTKPNIVIIPNIENSSPNGSSKVTSYPGNTKPLLRISIQKEFYSKQNSCTTNEADGNASANDTKIQKEITVNNETTNTAVTFKLDPITREIVLINPQIGCSEVHKMESKSMAEKQIIANVFCPKSLRKLYVRRRRDCTVLRKQLEILRDHYKQEEEEIVTLQKNLSEVGGKVDPICSKDSPKPKCVKRKDTIDSIQPDDYGNFMRKVKKTKHDIQRRKENLDTTENPPAEIQKNEFNAIDENRVPSFSDVDKIDDDAFSNFEYVTTDFSEKSTGDETV